MIKQKILALFLILLSAPAFAQSWEEVTNSGDTFLFADGWGATVDEADKQALNSLISSISVAVNSEIQMTIDEDESNLQATIQTYSSATLTNTTRVILDNTLGNIHVGRYIKKSEINRIFEGRIRAVKEYIRLGLMAEESGKIDDALRCYYWAFSLLKSVQHPAEVTYTDDEIEEEITPLTWLPAQMNNIFSDLKVEQISNDGTYVEAQFTFKGERVGSLDFSYFDGADWSALSSVKDGCGVMEFAQNMVPENIPISYEFQYLGQAHINAEIKSVLEISKSPIFPKSRVNLKTTKKVVAQQPETTEAQLTQVTTAENYKNVIDSIATAINAKNYKPVLKYFTPEGEEMFRSLLMTGNARAINSNNCTFTQFGDDVIARSLQVSLTFKYGLRKNFVEDITFTFNKERKIECLAFGLDKKAKDDIMSKTVWSEASRQTIIQFLENYKTAYSLKRLDYLKTIFDDDAVIIVGHVAKRIERDTTHPDSQPSYRTNKYVKRTLISKEEYLKRLELCFRSNEFINIRFANSDIRKAFKGEEYGIQIKQDYYSTNYGDEGYLYLQVDLAETDKPIIKVRTWQEEPDPEIGLFSIGNW